MTIHRLEVYLDSYNSEPFVREFADALNFSEADEPGLQQWIEKMSGRLVNIERHLRVEDIRRHCRTTLNDLVQATAVRVRLVD
ncbi:MAG: hypothetical protein KDI36_13825 [Pseudomonadales bacterium]|nr:hypothetical protein [Pseudomonadales bacterium]